MSRQQKFEIVIEIEDESENWGEQSLLETLQDEIGVLFGDTILSVKEIK